MLLTNAKMQTSRVSLLRNCCGPETGRLSPCTSVEPFLHFLHWDHKRTIFSPNPLLVCYNTNAAHFSVAIIIIIIIIITHQ